MTSKPFAERSIAVLKIPCGCKVWHVARYDTEYKIEYCPVHKAAPALMEALKTIRDSEGKQLRRIYARFCEKTAREALKKIEEEA